MASTRFLELQFRLQTQQMERGFGKVTGSMRNLAKGFAGLYVVEKVKDFLVDSAKAAMHNEAATATLANMVDHSGGSWKRQGAAIEDNLKKMSSASGFIKSDLSDAYSRLIASTHDTGESFKLLGDAENLARARHMDLTTAAQLLGKVHNGITTGARKLGIQTETVTYKEDHLKRAHNELLASGKKLTEKQKEEYKQQLANAKADDKRRSGMATLKLIHQQYANASDAYAKTSAGAMARLGAQWEEFKVTVGDHVLPAAAAVGEFLATVLPPIFAALDSSIMSTVKWFIRWKEILLPVGAALGVIVGYLVIYHYTMKAWVAITKLAAAVQVLWNLALTANPIGIIIVAIAAFVAALVVLWTRHKGFRDAVIRVWQDVKEKISTVWNFIHSTFDKIITKASEVGSKIKSGIVSGISGLGSVLRSLIAGYFNYGFIDPANWLIDKVLAIEKHIPGSPDLGIGNDPIPRLARGGLVTRPTLALIGEAGPEMVIPLRGSSGTGGNGINVYVNKTGADPREIGAAISWALRMHA